MSTFLFSYSSKAAVQQPPPRPPPRATPSPPTSTSSPSPPHDDTPSQESSAQQPSLLDELNFKKSESLIYINNAEGLLELRAGHIDELIILATQTTNRDFVYQDAFLLTYRTYIETIELMEKLEYRFRKFNKCEKDDAERLRAARSSFSLLVRKYVYCSL